MRNYNNRNSRNNNELYGNSSSSNSGGFNSKARGEQFRNRAIDGIDRLNETDDLMKNSMRLVNDSKELGVSTLVKVDEQTEILANTKQNVDETLVMSNSAGSILNSMAYRYCANKALLWVIIVVLIVANVGVYMLNHPATPNKDPSKPKTRVLQTHAIISHMPPVMKQHHVAFIQKGILPKQVKVHTNNNNNNKNVAAKPVHHTIQHKIAKVAKLMKKNIINKPATIAHKGK